MKDAHNLRLRLVESAALLAADPERPVVLGLRSSAQRRGQRGIRVAYPAPSRSLGYFFAGLSLASRQRRRVQGAFAEAPGDSQHVRIPPAAHTCQSDVETVHRLEEDELFDLEDFSSRGDFLAKVHSYQLYFNLVRPSSHKQNLSPWQIIERLAPRSPLELCLLPPVLLDYYLTDSGRYDVGRLPYDRKENAAIVAACGRGAHNGDCCDPGRGGIDARRETNRCGHSEELAQREGMEPGEGKVTQRI